MGGTYKSIFFTIRHLFYTGYAQILYTIYEQTYSNWTIRWALVFLTVQNTGCRKLFCPWPTSSLLLHSRFPILCSLSQYFYIWSLGYHVVRFFIPATHNLTHPQISYCAEFQILHVKKCIFHLSNTTPRYVFFRTLTDQYFKWEKYVYLGQFSIIFLYLEPSVTYISFF